MSTFTLTLEVKPATDIRDAVNLAIIKAIQLDINIRFMFNGIRVFVTPASDLHAVLDKYNKEFDK